MRLFFKDWVHDQLDRLSVIDDEIGAGTVTSICATGYSVWREDARMT